MTRAVRADAVLVVKQPSLSPERELNRFGIGQDFVIPDHAAVARQDIRGKVRVDLIRIGVLRQVPFGTEIKAPELVPVATYNKVWGTTLDYEQVLRHIAADPLVTNATDVEILRRGAGQLFGLIARKFKRLSWKFLLPPAGGFFITSDNPVLYNNSSTFSLVMEHDFDPEKTVDVQMLMPISPKVAAVGIDYGGRVDRPSSERLNHETLAGHLFQLFGVDSSKDVILHLSLMKVETMLNHPNSWPAQDHLYIDGLEYNRIDETALLNVKSQLHWLRLQLKHTLFVQPYEQLANVMRTMGRDEDAKKVLIAKNEREGEFIPLRFNRFGDWMWFKIVGPPIRYGYRPWNALLASFVVIGSFVEFAQLHQQVVAPLQIVFLLCSDQTVKQTH